MIEDIRKTALAHAMELSRSRINPEASEIVEDASVFEGYLAGHISCSATINEAASSLKPSLNFSSGNSSISDGEGGKFFPISKSQVVSDLKDQSFTGGDVPSTHNTSSSPKDGESVGEVTTPSRTETVAPDTQPVMRPCTHTRTDGEGV